MKKSDRPSEYFVGAILRAHDKAKAAGPSNITCSTLWDYICMAAVMRPGGFAKLFEWDTSTAKSINRIGTIAECIERGYVPGLRLGERLAVLAVGT